MSDFRFYVNQFDELARAAFKEITETTNTFKAAEERHKATPQKTGADPEYCAKAARIESEYQSALSALNKMQRSLPDDKLREVENLRHELEQAVQDSYCVRPDDLDHDVLTLIMSGILRPDEYRSLMDRATNATMKRIIAHHAASAAASAEKDRDFESARILRNVAQHGARYNGHEHLEAFDALTDIFRRTLKNNAMIPYWQSLSSPYFDIF